jgi:hypothetical protein
MSINGKCLCGAVRITASAPPIAARTCWCRNCQFIAAGSSTVNACFRKEDVTITGPLKDFPITADSGNVLHWRFCPTCGTQVSSEAEVRPHLIFIRAGTLDDPSLAAPMRQSGPTAPRAGRASTSRSRSIPVRRRQWLDSSAFSPSFWLKRDIHSVLARAYSVPGSCGPAPLPRPGDQGGRQCGNA